MRELKIDPERAMQTVELPGGERVPVFGLGTWFLGERPARRAEELAALRLGLDHGATLIDSAEMYGDGRSEELVGEAIRGRRDRMRENLGALEHPLDPASLAELDRLFPPPRGPSALEML